MMQAGRRMAIPSNTLLIRSAHSSSLAGRTGGEGTNLWSTVRKFRFKRTEAERSEASGIVEVDLLGHGIQPLRIRKLTDPLKGGLALGYEILAKSRLK